MCSLDLEPSILFQLPKYWDDSQAWPEMFRCGTAYLAPKGGDLVRDGDTAPCSLSPQAFHYMSFAILVVFMLEIFFKIFVFRLEFFHHKFEIMDAIVVVVSFVLDLVLLFKNHHFEALGLLILLRLWRVARIINGASPVLHGGLGAVLGTEVAVWSPDTQDLIPGPCRGCCLSSIRSNV